MSELMPEKEQSNESKGELAFQVFCAVVFLSMIGLVFYNAMLRYVFKASFAPSEEWARILFMYITFFGAIEGFYRGRHIAVDMFTSLLSGATRPASCATPSRPCRRARPPSPAASRSWRPWPAGRRWWVEAV